MIAKKYLAMGIILLAVAAAAYPLWLGRYFASGDTHDVFIPLETFFQQEQLAGRIPSWNPDIAWGFPVIASAQIGFFYPLALIARFLPIWVYLPAMLYIHLVMAATGTYFLLRRQQASHRAALLGALAFGLSQFIWQHITHLNIIFTLSWLPWQFLVAHILAGKPRLRLRHTGLFALVLGLPFLVGHIQLPLFTSLITAIFFLYQRRITHQPILSSLTALGWVGVIALGIAAAQLLPTAELAQLSNRGTNSEFNLTVANQYSWPLYHLPTIIFPRFFAQGADYFGKRLEIEYGFFIGTVPLLLALFASKQYWQRYRFEIGLAAVTFLLALGTWSPFRLIGLEPSLWIFSAPARWLLFTTFALSLLAAHGLDAAVATPKLFRSWLLISLITIGAFVLLGNIGLWSLPENTPQLLFDQVHDFAPELLSGRPPLYYVEKLAQMQSSITSHSISLQSPYTYLPLLVLLLALLTLRNRRWPYLLVGITAAELILIATTTSVAVPWSLVLEVPAVVSELPESVRHKQARLLTIQPPDTDTGLLFSNPTLLDPTTKIQGTHALVAPLTNAQFNIPGVEWPASLLQPAHNQILANVRENPSPEAAYQEAVKRNIGAIIRADLKNEHLPLIRGTKGVQGYSEIDISKTTTNEITVTSINPAPRAQLINQPTIPVSYTAVSPTHTTLTFIAPVADTLLIRDNWYPGWVATIDNNPAPITLHDDIFRAVAVPAGLHTVSLEYRPRPLYIGLTLTAITLAMCLAVILWPRRKTI